jgi:hypothetical protein
VQKEDQKPQSITEFEDMLLIAIMFFTLVTWIIAVTRLLFG